MAMVMVERQRIAIWLYGQHAWHLREHMQRHTRAFLSAPYNILLRQLPCVIQESPLKFIDLAVIALYKRLSARSTSEFRGLSGLERYQIFWKALSQRSEVIRLAWLHLQVQGRAAGAPICCSAEATFTIWPFFAMISCPSLHKIFLLGLRQRQHVSWGSSFTFFRLM